MSLLRFTTRIKGQGLLHKSLPKTLLQHHSRSALLCSSSSFVRHYTVSTLPDAKDAQSIVQVLEQFKDDTKTAAHYNELLKQLALEGRSVQAQKVYDQIFRQHDVEADIHTFSQLMLSYINDGKYADAMEIYYDLRDHEDSPNNAVKNLRLDAKIYGEMIQSLTDPKNMVANGNQFDPTAEPLYAYSVNDEDLALFQDIDGDSQPALLTALTLFNDMRHLEIQPTPSMYSCILQACIQQQDAYVLEKIHKLIRMDLYLDPDVNVYNDLMQAYYAVGDGPSVLEIWDMSETHHDEKSISTVFKTCLDYGLKTRARAIWDSLDNQNIPIQDFNNFLSCQLNGGEDVKDIEETYKSLQKLHS